MKITEALVGLFLFFVLGFISSENCDFYIVILPSYNIVDICHSDSLFYSFLTQIILLIFLLL